MQTILGVKLQNYNFQELMNYFYSYTRFTASSLSHADIINLNTELFLYRKTERKSLLQEPSSSLRELHRQTLSSFLRCTQHRTVAASSWVLWLAGEGAGAGLGCRATQGGTP